MTYRVTDAELKSNIRVATLRLKLTDAIAAVLDGDPDLTYEEILDALLFVAQRQVGHLRYTTIHQL
jgi:hypothetical protein